MDKKRLDDLLKTLEVITFLKSMLPFQLRGHVNALGLYVQARQAGQRMRLQAGGSLRSYLDVWQEENGDWQIGKFDTDTWERRFARLVEPTYQIADFLTDRIASFGDLDSEGASALDNAFQHYKDTGVWLELPKVPKEVEDKLAIERARVRKKEEREKRIRRISDNEAWLKKDPLDRDSWASLPYLYYQEQRYKDMENALKMQLKIKGAPYSSTYKELGKTYLSALSTSIRGKGILVYGGYIQSVVTSGTSDYSNAELRALSREKMRLTDESLGYSLDELRDLAKENLSKAYEMGKSKELELSLRAVDALSVEAFEELECYEESEWEKGEASL